MPLLTGMFEPDLDMERCLADYPPNNYSYLQRNASRGGDWSMYPLTPDDAIPYVETSGWDKMTGKKYGYDNRSDVRDNRVGTDRIDHMLGCFGSND